MSVVIVKNFLQVALPDPGYGTIFSRDESWLKTYRWKQERSLVSRELPLERMVSAYFLHEACPLEVEVVLLP